MPKHEDDQPAGGMRFSTMDFSNFTETLEAAIYPDKPVSSLGEGDLSFVINAPLSYRPVAKLTSATLFFDHADCVRELPDGCYQVKCAHALEKGAFADWARQAIGLLAHTLKHKGMVCRDLGDLLRVLKESTTRQLHLAIIPYQNRNELPLEQLRAFRFSTLYGSLFAGGDMTLEMYSELGCALEEISPALKQIALTANLHAIAPSILLLGEFDSGIGENNELDDLWDMSLEYFRF